MEFKMAGPIIRSAFNKIISINHIRLFHINSKAMRRGMITSKLRSNESQMPSSRKKIEENVTASTQFPQPVVLQGDYHNLQVQSRKIQESSILKADVQTDAAVGQNGKHTHKFSFEKVKAGDKQFGKVMTLLKSKQQREKTGKVLLEGKRLITDAILAGAMIETIYFCRHEALEDVPVDSLDAKFVKVPQKDVNLWTDVATPQGILAVCKKTDTGNLRLLQDETSLPVTLICDNIREPGNLGALLRSAAAVNCHNVLVTKGCVDIWEPKVLRAGCGAHFRIPIQSNIKWQEIHAYLDSHKVVHVADGNYTQRERNYFESNMPRKDTMVLGAKSDETLEQALASVIPIIAVEPYFALDWTTPCALVIGGESHGLSLEAVELCEEREGSKVFIPMANGMNSLNSAHAASIILYEARKQLMEKSQR